MGRIMPPLKISRSLTLESANITLNDKRDFAGVMELRFP